MVPDYLPRKGLVALWLADGNAYDSAGKNHGALCDGASYGPGKSGEAFKLDGKDDYVDVGNRPALQITGSQTIAMWIFPDRMGLRQNPIAKAFGGEGTITLEPSGCVNYYYGTSGDNRLPYEAYLVETPLEVKQWTHIAVVRDLEQRKVRWYLNGVQVLEKPAAFTSAGASPLPLYIGKGYENNFSGMIDEVAIWNRALSGDEISKAWASIPGLPHITRIDTADQILLKNGDVLRGTITKITYTVTTFPGKFEIPGADVVGFVSDDEKSRRIRLVLTDGQVLVGTLAQPTLRTELHVGPTIDLPIDQIRACGYRITKNKPAALSPPGATVILASGDRLSWTNPVLRLQLQTTYGKIELPDKGIRNIRFDDRGDGRYYIRLCNGSVLSGALLPKKLALEPQLDPKRTIDTETIRWLTWPVDSAKPAADAVAVMRNKDRLLGRITDEKLIIHTAFGEAVIHPAEALTMKFEAATPPTVTAKMWDGSILRGQLDKPVLTFAIVPEGPTVELPVADIASIVRESAQPAGD